jgi:alpha-1,6-mannosyltransferase
MIGLMLAALTVSLRGARRWALVLFTVAATIKLPAAAGIVFLTAAQLSGETRREKWRLCAEAVVIPGAVIAAVSEFTGYGWSWLTPSALHIPTELRILTTPVVSLATLLASLVHALGDGVSTGTVITVVQDVVALGALALIAWLVTRTNRANATYLLGVTMLVIVLASPTLWPWYLLWGLTILAVTGAQNSAWLAATAALAMLLVGPGGTPMIGGNGFYVAGPLALAGLGLLWWHARWRRVLRGLDRVG